MGWAGREEGKIERKGGREEDREALNKQSLLPPRPIPPPSPPLPPLLFVSSVFDFVSARWLGSVSSSFRVGRSISQISIKTGGGEGDRQTAALCCGWEAEGRRRLNENKGFFVRAVFVLPVEKGRRGTFLLFFLCYSTCLRAWESGEAAPRGGHGLRINNSSHALFAAFHFGLLVP